MKIAIETAGRPMAAFERHPETQAFQAAAAQGRFVLPRCGDCGRFHWYPRAHCPFCFGAALAWTDVSGRGRIYSYTVMRRAKPPYAIAYVTLEEGPTMMTNLVHCDFDALRIGMPVTVLFQHAPDGPLVPMFRPAGDA